MNRISKFFSCILTVTLLYSINGYSQQQKLSENDRDFINNTLCYFQLAHQFADSVWPGYDLSKIPIIFHNYESQKAFLFNYDDSLPAGYSFLKEFPNVAFKDKNAVYNRAYELNVDIGTQKGVTFEISNNFNTLNYNTITHEVFHHYQKIKGFFYHSYPINTLPDASELALAQIEQEYLSGALTCATSQDFLTILKRFLSIRNERYDNLDNNIIAFENRQEAIEGTAKYVEYKLSDRIYRDKKFLKPSDSSYYKSFEHTINEVVDSLRSKISIKIYKNGINYYNTGFSLCVILEKLSIDDWQIKIENRETLTDLLKESVRFTHKDTLFLEEIKRSTKFLSHLNKAKQVIAKEKGFIQKFFTAFNNSTGYKIVLKFDKSVSNRQVMFMVENMLRSETGAVLLKNSTISYNSSFATFEITSDILADTKNGEQIFIFYLEKPKIKINEKFIDLKTMNKKYQGKIKIEEIKGYIKADKTEIDIKDNEIHLVMFEN